MGKIPAIFEYDMLNQIQSEIDARNGGLWTYQHSMQELRDEFWRCQKLSDEYNKELERKKAQEVRETIDCLPEIKFPAINAEIIIVNGAKYKRIK